MYMNDLKKDLHKRIESLSDDQVDQAYGLVVNLLKSHKMDEIDELGLEEKEAIEKGLAQIEAGKTVTHDQVMAGFRKQLNK
ncbi:MAG: putative transcriptional regulator [Cyclobacteriaceae bacterium]|jgi:predicted transcriptional regulator